ncbi:ImmA/IrrE family metallo-endopeptidase [Pseudorhodoferax sp. LjRoot39]|uniref:ImmA/IrrE family metallo-endopeptidase n=1 Tax=Pseudorhodoferax sp. LjRoot39 TaxID=3342328 RepID=UPI003ECEF13C
MTIDAKTLYRTVAQLGLKPAQVRRLLPEWWDTEAEKDPSGISELAMLLGRRLSVDVGALMRGQLSPKGAMASVAFKHRAGVAADTLAAASAIASSLGQTVLAALPASYRKLPSRAVELSQAATDGGARLLGFDALLTLCWEHGIPVIPLPNLPVGVRKMDGAALQIGERPVIVIAKKKSSRAWLSFILAHEIGHIALGHLKPGSTIVDVSLQEGATYATDEQHDAQEAEADAFALEAMGGDAVESVVGRWTAQMAPVELAVKARSASKDKGIEPGHFILRHAFINRRWPEAVIALRFLSEDVNPEAALLKEFERRLNMDAVSDDMQDLVAQITGWSGTHP